VTGVPPAWFCVAKNRKARDTGGVHGPASQWRSKSSPSRSFGAYTFVINLPSVKKELPR
jgi:hypothetical protein